MFTSVTDNENGRILRHALGNILFAVFCIVFGAIYEAFSFGVFSYFMIYAFAFPLAAGITCIIMYMRKARTSRIFLNLLNSAAVTAALGSLAAGVVEIYGTENRLLIIYPIVTAVLFGAAVMSQVIRPKKTAAAENEG